MVALKFPKHEFKGLLNVVWERIKHIYEINLLDTALTKSAFVQTSNNTITPHASKLKSISKYQKIYINVSFVDLKNTIFYTSLWSRWNIIHVRCAIRDSQIKS